MIFVLRRLTACFSGPLRRLTAYFSAPFGLTFSAKSANLGVKGGQLKILNLFTVFRKVTSFIYEFFSRGDRVPLMSVAVLGQAQQLSVALLTKAPALLVTIA